MVRMTKDTEVDLIIRCDLQELGLGPVLKEFRFAEERRFRFDYAIGLPKLGVEIEGGVWLRNGGGRHNRGSGFVRDIAKYNLAAIHGWRILRFTPQDVLRGVARSTLRRWKEANA